MAKDDVGPSDWTLRFKHGKHTILIFAEPLATFTSIKTDLLTILHERYPHGLPVSTSLEPVKIPENINHVALAVLVDVYEPNKGWTELNTSPLQECPKGVGLKDGSVLAFTFLEDGSDWVDAPVFKVEWSSYDENFEMDDAEGQAGESDD